MPFCTQCGNQVNPGDLYCGACGARQEQAGTSPGPNPWQSSGPNTPRKGDPLPFFTNRNASLFCYLPWVGWIASIVVLAADKFREQREVRFHAFQGLYLFVIWLFVDWVFGPLTGYSTSTRLIERIMKIGLVITSLFMVVKTSQGETIRLPVLGELAERSVSEQR
jgi:uncharacterized membrane protein